MQLPYKTVPLVPINSVLSEVGLHSLVPSAPTPTPIRPCISPADTQQGTAGLGVVSSLWVSL